MHDYMSFFAQHWVLSSLFVAVVLALMVLEYYTNAGGGQRVEPTKAVELMNREAAVVVDVRPEDLFRHGHIIRAIHLDADQLTEKSSKLRKYKDKPIIMVGENDQVALKVAAALEKQGFSTVKVLAGGMSAWRSASLPVETT